MVLFPLFATVLACLASANPHAHAADDRASSCHSIDDCDFDQQCLQGTCHAGGTASGARAADTGSALPCDAAGCRRAAGTDYIGNPSLAVQATCLSPVLAFGAYSGCVSEWTAEGTGGVVVNPLLGAGGAGWTNNEVAIRAFWADDGFSYILDELPVGDNVTVSFMVRDSQGTWFCSQPSTYVLYVEVEGTPRRTFRVTPHAGKKRVSFDFQATDTTMKMRFSTEKNAYDGCGPFFSNVKAVV
ncbi:hypothetical protein A9K55_001739 [Cordyceps militaris]|uniref:Uncharacterized protein n=1 Tax=Cordyceps militaris TaxID=73501 RepID=A0A2H4SQQ1_CORMI|nr:hypothetical protein A9K55_001739 [Cordyceps militaris]